MSSSEGGSETAAVKGAWSAEEDELLLKAIEANGTRKWSVLASHLPGRTGKQCRERWHNQLDTALSRDGWTGEEDQILLDGQVKMGNKWAEIAKLLPGRTDNSVKNRWYSTCSRILRQQTSGAHPPRSPPAPPRATPSTTRA